MSSEAAPEKEGSQGTELAQGPRPEDPSPISAEDARICLSPRRG